MSREHRKHKRKARNAELRDNPPKPSVIPALAARDPSTRWSNLTARGGVRMSLVPVDRMAPVGEHMGLREIRGAPIVRSNPVYSLSGDLLALTYRETIYYN